MTRRGDKPDAGRKPNVPKLIPHTAVMKISEINLDPKNPRETSLGVIKQIAKLVEALGPIDHVVVDRHRNVVRGEELLRAYEVLGVDEVPVIVAEYMTDQERMAASLGYYRLAEKSTWNERKLAERFRELMSSDFPHPIEITGYELPEIDSLLEILDDSDGLDKADEFEPASGPAVSQLGDEWTMGVHRLLCGSAREPDSYVRLLQGQLARVVLTDPPYNVAVNGHVRVKSGHREFPEASGEMTEKEFGQFLRDCLQHMVGNLVAGGLLYVFMDWRHIHDLISAGLDNALDYLNLCVWDKGSGAMGSFYRSGHELVAVFRNGKTAHINNVQLGRFGRSRTNVWRAPGASGFHRKNAVDDFDAHPTLKPLKILSDAILDSTHRGDIVLDPFSGAGSTILAAERSGRRGFGIELDPLHVDTAVLRWEKMTGKRAINQHGQTFAQAAATRGIEASA